MQPHVPPPFPPANLKLEPLVTLVGKANACLSRYDGLLESLVSPDVMLSPLLMKEAELSSRIEGTIATANEVYQQEAGEEFEPEKAADIQEILNYRRTLRIAGEEITDRPITLTLIRQMHKTLMAGVRGEKKGRGQFRKGQNWIGPEGCSMEEAYFIPPQPLLLPELLDQFIAFVNLKDDNLDPIVHTALMHAQFEIIHPFDDGNGRIGRLLIPLLLAKRQSLVGPSLFVSGYLEAHRDQYYRALGGVSRNQDWSGWIKFFLEAIIAQANSNLDLVRQVIALYAKTKTGLADLLHTDKAVYITDFLFERPIFRASELHQRIGVQRQRAAQYIRLMRQAMILQELRPARGRRAALLAFEDLWTITR